MSRLIDAEELYELIEKEFDGVCVYDVDPSEAVNDFQNIVDLAPTVDAEPIRHGRWEDTNSRGFKKCSHCGEDFLAYIVEDYEYCPRCGANIEVE